MSSSSSPAPPPSLRRLADAIRAGNGGTVSALLGEAVSAAASASPEAAEAMLGCLLDAFSSGGDNAKAVLDDLLLELLPAAAGLAHHSAACCRSLSGLCSLAAAACSPRDTITAFLEVIGNTLQDSPGPDSLQFACDLLLLLPAQVAKLSRRKAANAVECCTAAAMLAKVHGQVLASWSLHQMALAAQQAAPTSSAESAARSTLNRLDTFLAANWQAYLEFAQGMVQQVLRQETDPEPQETACQGICTLVLTLLQHLTAVWQPLALHPLALQLLKDPGSAQLMPSSESVAAPAPMLATAHRGQHHTQGQQQQQGADSESSDAEAAVLELLQLLQECGGGSWQQLPCNGGCAAAGAGLAALYSSCIPEDGASCVLTVPATAVETVQLACQWCCAVVEESDNNILAILKALALLQLAAAHAKSLDEPSLAQPSAASSAAAEQLLPHLRTCLGLLTGVMSQAPVQALRSQAALTLQQLLQAVPPPVCYACLQQLLSCGESDGGVHPEVAALLVQEVRGLLVRQQQSAGPSFSAASCVRLVTPWLLQQGPVGWQSPDTLPSKANAVCAALAVVRLGLLQQGGSSLLASPAGLKGALTVLSAAVADALQALQAANSVEQRLVGGGDASRPIVAADGRACVPGEAQGAGQAVDAWLAVSRVQDVLDRVLEVLSQ